MLRGFVVAQQSFVLPPGAIDELSHLGIVVLGVRLFFTHSHPNHHEARWHQNGQVGEAND